MKHLASLVLCVALAAATPVQAQDETCTERVKFPSGSTGTTVSATIWVAKPGTDTDVRVLYFESDAWSSDDDSKLSGDRKDNDWLVKLNGKESYLVFYEVIWGG